MLFNIFIFSTIWIANVMSTIFYSDLDKDMLSTKDLPPRGYGMYYLHIRYLETCERDTAIDEKNENQFNLELKYTNNQVQQVLGYIYVPNGYRVVKAVFLPSLLKTNKSEPIFQKITNSPCTDLLVALPMKQLIDMDSECVAKKGNYTLKKFIPDTWIHKIFKRQIMYERLKVQFAYYSNVGRTFCLKLVVDLKPLKKDKKN